MCISTWDHLQTNPVVKYAEELLLATTVHFIVKHVGSNITSNAEKLPLSCLWRSQEIAFLISIAFHLGNARLAYNNLSLITVWMWTHCCHFPSLLCRMNRFRIYTIYKATIMAKPQTKGRSAGSAGLTY